MGFSTSRLKRTLLLKSRLLHFFIKRLIFDPQRSRALWELVSNRDKKQKHTDARLEQNTIQNQRHETTCAGISQVHAVWNGSNKICDCATNGRKIFLIMEPQPLTNRATPSSTPASSTRRRQLLLYPFTCTNECNAGDVTEERRPWQSESVSWMSWRGVRRRFARASLFQAFVAFFKFVKRRVMNRY